MKKFVLFLILLMFFIPIKIKAFTPDYDIVDYLIDSEILENGDLAVKELIVLDGSFHGYERDITYKNSKLSSLTNNYEHNEIYNAKGIENMKIYAKYLETDEPSFDTFDEVFKPLTKAFYDTEAVNGNYLETSTTDGKSYVMKYEGEDKKGAFYLSYTIKSAVVMHPDVAELYWTFIGDGFLDEIRNLQIRVKLPKQDLSDKFRVWAHGDITGDIKKSEDNSYVLATMKSLSKESPVDIRMTFDPSFISDKTMLNSTKDDALDEILKVEEKRAEVANKQRKTAILIYNVVLVSSCIFLVLLVSWWIYIYIRFDKEYKSSFVNEYNREFIDDYNVEVVDYLMTGNVTPNAMSASILNLIYKKNIKVQEISKKGKKKEYEFTLNNRDNVNDTEDLLLDFLFETVGKDNKFTTKQLDTYAKSSYEMFNSKYSNWLNCVRKDGEKQEFFEKNGLPVVSGIFFLLIAMLIGFLSFYYQIDLILGYLVLPFSFVFLFYTLLMKKRTKKGNEHYTRWKAFKKFLKDFGNFDIKELPQITLWERYMVYATVFGLADEVEKAMNTKIKEMPIEYQNSYYPTWGDFYIASSIHNAINRSVSIANTANVRASSMSSGSGAGGGFSSGAGFGGGGGGGHGF